MTRSSPLALAIALGLSLSVSSHTFAASDADPSYLKQGKGLQTYIVVFEEPAIASFHGFDQSDKNRPKLAATSPAASGSVRLDVKSPAVLAYGSYLRDLRTLRINGASQQLGRQLVPEFVYEYALNGMAVALTAKEAEQLARQPGVKRVQRETIEHPLTDRGPTWIKASQIWSGSANNGTPKRGEGMVVGVIDTGIMATHQSFLATAPVGGYVHINPRGSTLGNVTTEKNSKLIGIWDFTTGTGDNEANDGLDVDGHGTHVASTAAGNALNFTSGSYSAQMSGVAPRANIISYKACEKESKCRGSWTLAAINQAVADQVDVINYSIGGDAYDPWRSVGGSINDQAEAFLAAREAGILSAVAAGNDGPSPGTHSSPANAPWVLGVAAVSHDRATFNTLTGLAGGATSAPGGGTLSGSGNTNSSASVASSPIVRDPAYPYCADGTSPGGSPATGATKPPSWTAGSLSGKIVVCERATQHSVGYARVEMAHNIQQAGGVGMILLNQSSDGLSTVADAYAIPTVHLAAADASAMRTWLASGAGHVGGMSGSLTQALASFGDRLASFSGRGPVTPMGVLKPDLAAPGVSIFAAGSSSATSIVSKNGTSMAAPHVAGGAALLKSTNSALTANQITSALALTARNSVVLPSGSTATPHDQGAGTIDLEKAIKAGLFLDITGAEFRAASASAAQTLNVSNLTHDNCFATCSLSRTFKLMPGVASGQYQVTVELPSGATATTNVNSFSLSGSGSQTITINFDVGARSGEWVYGRLLLTNLAADGRPNLSLPIAVYSSVGNVASKLQRTVSGERGSFDIDFSGLVYFNDARFIATELLVPRVDQPTLAQDPTASEVYDSFGTGTYVVTGTIPASPSSGAVDHLLEVTTDSPAPDVDLFIGVDTDGDGAPDAAEERCKSNSSDSTEECSLRITSTNVAQTYWILVQSYNSGGSSHQATVEIVTTPLSAATRGTLVATGPGRTSTNQAFKVRVGYDDPSFLSGQRRVGYLLMQPRQGSTAARVRLDLTRNQAGFEPFALANGVARAVSLPAGAAHDRLIFSVPANASSVTFSTQGNSGTVRLDAYYQASPTGPVIAAAPAGSADASSALAGANQSITLNSAALSGKQGRWYVKPTNTGSDTASINVTATINSVSQSLPLRLGSYYNPSRGGHGMFVYPASNQWALLWYTYLHDGSPTWYYVQGAQPGSDGTWNGTIYRSAWNGSQNAMTVVGNMLITPSSETTFTLAYNVDGLTGSETMQPFLSGCPTVSGVPLNVSGHWYEPTFPGYGYSVQVNPNYEFHAAFVYDGQGIARFLVAERSGAFNADAGPLVLEQLSGFAPLGAHVAPTRTTVGTLTRSYAANDVVSMGATATFAAGVSGNWSRSASVDPLTSRQGCTP